MPAVPLTEGLLALERNLLECASTQQAVRIRRVIVAAAESAPELVRQEALATLPREGGLNVWVANAVTQVVQVGGARSSGVAIRTRKTGHDMVHMDQGQVRHRVYGTWRKGVPTQVVKPGFFSRPVETVIIPAVSAALAAEMAETARRMTA